MEDNENNKIGAIVKTARLQLGALMERSVSQEEFGDLLMDGLVNVPLSRTSVSAWENGKYEPDSDLLWTLVVQHYGTKDWRLYFGLNCLRAKIPDVFDIGIVNIKFPIVE